MIQIEKIWRGIRQEGVNFGLPMVFVKPGVGAEYERNSDLTRELLHLAGRGWICFVGENSTQIGMGTVITDLSTLQFYIEVECNSSVREPGWFKKVDRWVVDWVSEPLFDFGKLRDKDMVRFTVANERDLVLAQVGFEHLKFIPGTRYLKVVGHVPRAEEFVRQYERARLYYAEE